MATFRSLIEAAQAHMEPGEDSEAAILGVYVTNQIGRKSARRGVMIATDRRVVFYSKKLGGYEFEVFPYPTISSIKGGRGLLGAHVTLQTAGNRAYMKRIRNGAINRFTDTVSSRIGRLEAEAPGSTPAAGTFADQIEKLGALRDRGLLTQEEFEAKKTEILARL
jgi:hypothetical protein